MPKLGVDMETGLSIRITVRGRLGRRLAAAFDGLTLVPHGVVTDLVGDVVDHAQLFGVLTRIRDLGLELDSVRVRDAGHERSL